MHTGDVITSLFFRRYKVSSLAHSPMGVPMHSLAHSPMSVSKVRSLYMAALNARMSALHLAEMGMPERLRGRRVT